MTLNDAFSVLIAQPFWYKGSGYTKQYAYRDKKNFQNGKLIPEERMRHYLKRWKIRIGHTKLSTTMLSK